MALQREHKAPLLVLETKIARRRAFETKYARFPTPIRAKRLVWCADSVAFRSSSTSIGGIGSVSLHGTHLVSEIMTEPSSSSREAIWQTFVLALTFLSFPSLAAAQSFSSFDIIQGLARPGGVEETLSTGINPRPGGLAPLDLSASQRTVASDEERGVLRNMLAAYAPPSIDIEILFRFGSAEIDPAAHPSLAEVAQALISPELSRTQILIAGHTDSVGGAAYNLDLSLRRAEAVRTYLVTRFNIPQDRLFVVGFGFERLKDFLEPEAAVNRRVEFINATGIFK